MKRLLTIGLIPLVLGAVGAVLRAYELAFRFNPITGLPENAIAATPMLIALCVLMAAAAAFFAFRNRRPSPSEVKSAPAFTIAAALAFGAMLGLFAFLLMNRVQESAALHYMLAAFTLLAAVSIAITGIKHLHALDNGMYAFIAVLPVFWACFSLILVFRDRIADPIIADYIYLLFALISILVFTYAHAGYIYSKNRFAVAAISAMMGTFFCVIELVSPFIARMVNAAYVMPQINFSLALPLAVFAVYMPFAAVQMLKNENGIVAKR